MDQGSRNPEVGADNQAPNPESDERFCTVCDEPIPEKRMKAAPTATMCVHCTAATGDVARLRRYDETLPDGEIVGTYFKTPTPYIKEALRRVAKINMCGLSAEEQNGSFVSTIKVADSEGEWGLDAAKDLQNNTAHSIEITERRSQAQKKRWASSQAEAA